MVCAAKPADATFKRNSRVKVLVSNRNRPGKQTLITGKVVSRPFQRSPGYYGGKYDPYVQVITRAEYVEWYPGMEYHEAGWQEYDDEIIKMVMVKPDRKQQNIRIPNIPDHQDIAGRTKNGQAIVIYQADCSCGKQYVGQTRMLITTRTAGHIRTSNGKQTGLGRHLDVCKSAGSDGITLKPLAVLSAGYMMDNDDGMDTAAGGYRFPVLVRLLEQRYILMLDEQSRLNLDVADQDRIKEYQKQVISLYGHIPSAESFEIIEYQSWNIEPWQMDLV